MSLGSLRSAGGGEAARRRGWRRRERNKWPINQALGDEAARIKRTRRITVDCAPVGRLLTLPWPKSDLAANGAAAAPRLSGDAYVGGCWLLKGSRGRLEDLIYEKYLWTLNRL